MADKALYHAKTHGRDQAVKAALSPESASQLNLEKVTLIAGDISKAVEDEIIIFQKNEEFPQDYRCIEKK